MGYRFPPEELLLVDITVRMFSEGCLRADVDLLGRIWSEEETRKADRLAALDVSAKDLGSNEVFSALLQAEGVEIVYKDGKNGPIPAFAKTDEFMRELLEDDDDRVRGLAEARLGVKSTLLQTRSETLGFMAQRGALAVYLRYCGAHTTRWSGGDSSNFQNFRRGSDIRKAILAPEGYLLATVDLAQIECRILNYLAGQTDVIDNFRNGHDPYVGIASAFYGRAITKADASERGTGKQAELSCGFGCGWKKFQRTAALGIYGPPVRLSDEDSQRAVGLYRATHPEVVRLWRSAENWLTAMNRGQVGEWGPMYVSGTGITLPNGSRLIYDTLEWAEDETDRFWRIKLRSRWTKLYGAKLVENVVQALARVVMSQACARIASAGFRPVLSSHDEWTFLVENANESYVAEACEFIAQEMKCTPDWLPGIPLDAELIVGDRYAK
jgi:DNA polymerase bacteriophage-type